MEIFQEKSGGACNMQDSAICKPNWNQLANINPDITVFLHRKSHVNLTKFHSRALNFYQFYFQFFTEKVLLPRVLNLIFHFRLFLVGTTFYWPTYILQITYVNNQTSSETGPAPDDKKVSAALVTV